MADGTPNFNDLGTDVVDVLQADGWSQSGVAAAGFWRVTQLNKAKKAVDIYTPAGTKQDRVWLTPAKGGKSAESSALKVLEAAGIAPAQRTQKGVRLVRVTRRDRAKKNAPGELEGPFNFSGRVLYYDPRYRGRDGRGAPGRYYDATTDIYLERDEDPHGARRNVVGYEDEEIVIGPVPFSPRARQNPIHGARRNPGATLASSSTRRPPAMNAPRRFKAGDRVRVKQRTDQRNYNPDAYRNGTVTGEDRWFSKPGDRVYRVQQDPTRYDPDPAPSRVWAVELTPLPAKNSRRGRR